LIHVCFIHSFNIAQFFRINGALICLEKWTITEKHKKSYYFALRNSTSLEREKNKEDHEQVSKDSPIFRANKCALE